MEQAMVITGLHRAETITTIHINPAQAPTATLINDSEPG